MYQSGVIKKRRAAGSIIAGAFILLIILSGYEFYLLNNRTQNEYQKVLSTMRTEDMSRTQENIKFTHIVAKPDEDAFELKIRNDGPELVRLEYAVIIQEGGTEPQYFELDNNPSEPYDTPNIMPSEMVTILLNDGITDIIEEGVYTIQVITSRGNVFPLQYPQKTEDYPYGYIVSGAISKVVGRVVPIYDSFQWGIMTKNNRTVPTMISSWVVKSDNKDNYVFRVEVQHYGKDPLTLGQKTGLYFNPIYGSAVQHQCYLVEFNKATNTVHSYENEVTLPGFNPSEGNEVPEVVTLYFATRDVGGDPIAKNFAANTFNSKTRYQVILGIYDTAEIYAQGFSLIAIEVD